MLHALRWRRRRFGVEADAGGPGAMGLRSGGGLRSVRRRTVGGDVVLRDGGGSGGEGRHRAVDAMSALTGRRDVPWVRVGSDVGGWNRR